MHCSFMLQQTLYIKTTIISSKLFRLQGRSEYKSTMNGIEPISADSEFNIYFNFDCKNPDHHDLSSACASHQPLAKALLKVASKVCCNCSIIALDEPVPASKTLSETLDIPSLTMDRVLTPSINKKTTPHKLKDKQISIQSGTPSLYPNTSANTSSRLKTGASGASRLSEVNPGADVTNQQPPSTNDEPGNRPKTSNDVNSDYPRMSSLQPALPAITTDEFTYLTITDPASHNITVAPDSDSSFQTDPF